MHVSTSRRYRCYRSWLAVVAFRDVMVVLRWPAPIPRVFFVRILNILGRKSKSALRNRSDSPFVVVESSSWDCRGVARPLGLSCQYVDFVIKVEVACRVAGRLPGRCGGTSWVHVETWSTSTRRDLGPRVYGYTFPLLAWYSK